MAYKTAGNVKYPFGVISPSDKTGVGLGFHTKDEADAFAEYMNKQLQNFVREEWSEEHWPVKPEPFFVFDVANQPT